MPKSQGGVPLPVPPRLRLRTRNAGVSAAAHTLASMQAEALGE